MKRSDLTSLIISAAFGTLAGCSTGKPAGPQRVPSLEYSMKLKQDRIKGGDNIESVYGKDTKASVVNPIAYSSMARGEFPEAKVHQVDGYMAPSNTPGQGSSDSKYLSNIGPNGEVLGGDIMVQESSGPERRDYVGPLALGDPGVASSLWQESRGGTDLFRDDRAWRPMDLITIVVEEDAQGSSEADTEVKSQSDISATLSRFLGLEQYIKDSIRENPLVTDASKLALIGASTQNDFKGEGDTNRKGKLKGRISVMVVEVLPSGVLRVEGEKIIAVNNEDQVLVLSGLVRTRDISSANEVSSSKLANVRIDYFGTGIIGEAQHGGWLGRAIRSVWPF